jgi:hypothetical protein
MELNDFQKYIDNFRFQIVDEKNVQRSSTWSIIHDENSVYVFVRVHGGKMKLSFHPIGSGDDGNDSQYGLTRKHASELEEQGYKAFSPLRWKRSNNKSKLNLGAKLLFPTDYMTGEVFQFVKVKKPKVSLPIANAGGAVEVSIFFHYIEPTKAEDALIAKGFTPVFYMTLKSGEIASVVAKQVPFDRGVLPKEGAYSGRKLSDENMVSSKNLHGILYSEPRDYQPIQLVEINGFQINN